MIQVPYTCGPGRADRMRARRWSPNKADSWPTTVDPSLSTTILLPCLPRLRGVAQESLRWGLLQMTTLE
jgi:hypothetical protein